jgi:glycosyltransferase involved in cell wall biosynthesis
MPKLIRITTVPISLKILLTGQMKYMLNNGFDVIAISAEGPEIRDIEKDEGVQHVVIPMTRQITPFADLKSLWLMYRFFKTSKPDIVHTHTPKAGLIGMLAALFAGVPNKIHTVAGLPLQVATGNKRKLLIAVEKLTYWAADWVLPNSDTLEQFIVDHIYSKTSKIKVLGNGSSNGIDITDFDPQTLDKIIIAEIKKEVNYNSENTYLLFVGRVVKDKGVAELVASFLNLSKNNSKLRLIIAGPLEDELDPLDTNTMHHIGNHSHIQSIGFTNKVKYYMYLADLFVFPSYREGFPNVLLQAGLMNCPIVCSNISGNIDIIKDHHTGLIFESKDALDLERALSYAIANEEKMIAMALRNKSQILELYDRRIVQKEILNFYINISKN